MSESLKQTRPSSGTEETWYDQTSNYLQNVRWKRVIARLKFVLWEIGTKLILGIIYFSIISEEFRILVPVLAERIHQLPGLSGMADYDATYRLDLAHFMSIFMLIAVWYLWDRILQLWLNAEIGFDDLSWNQDNDISFILLLGAIILGADICLFYLAISNVSWGAATFSFTAVIATAAYLSVLLFATYISIRLRKDLRNLRKESHHV